MKGKSKKSYYDYDEKPVKKSKPKKKPNVISVGDNPKGRETTAFIPHKDPKPVLEKIADTFREVTLQDKDEQVPEQKAVVIEECPCCANNCQCCVHKSGTVGHRCTCRCHA